MGKKLQIVDFISFKSTICEFSQIVDFVPFCPLFAKIANSGFSQIVDFSCAKV